MAGIARNRLFSPVLLRILLLLGLTGTAYSRVPNLGFVSIDDPSYVTRNPHVADGIIWQNLLWAVTGVHSANWHPLTWLSHMLDVQMFGLNPGGHHITSLVFHAANTVLLFLLLRRLTGRDWAAWFAAGLFAVHPLHVESVAWIAERKDVLSTFFFLVLLHAYAGYIASPGRLRYAAVCVVLALGLAAKPMLVSASLVLLLLDYWPLRRGLNRKTVTEKLPLFALSAASCVITFIAQRQGGAIGDFEQFPFGVRLANAITAYSQYMLKTFWPADLCVLYPHPGTSLPELQVFSSLVFLIAATAAAIKLGRRYPYVLVGWLWYLITLVPVVGLVQVGKQAIADRYTYIPHIGVFIALAWAGGDVLSKLPQRSRRITAAGLGSAVLLALTAVTCVQTGYWKSGVVLFEHAVRVVPDHYVTHYCLADAYLEEDRPRDAIKAFRRALRLKYDLPEAHCVMGYALAKIGKYEEGLASLRIAIRLEPNMAAAYNNIGGILLDQGRTDEAMKYIRKALKIKPDYAQAYYNLANAYERQGRPDLAESNYRRAVKTDPRFAPALTAVGAALLRKGDAAGAERFLREAVRLSPNLPEARLSFGALLIAKGNYVEAYRHLEKAVKLSPKSGEARYYYAVALSRLGYRDEAERERLKALELGFAPAANAGSTGSTRTGTR